MTAAVNIEKKLDRTAERLLAIGEELGELRRKVMVQAEGVEEVVPVSCQYERSLWEQFKALAVKETFGMTQRAFLEEALREKMDRVKKKV